MNGLNKNSGINTIRPESPGGDKNMHSCTLEGGLTVFVSYCELYVRTIFLPTRESGQTVFCGIIYSIPEDENHVVKYLTETKIDMFDLPGGF